MNVQKFKTAAESRGITVKSIIECLGIDESTYYRKLGRSKNTFSVEEAQKLSALLNLNNAEARDIFLS